MGLLAVWAAPFLQQWKERTDLRSAASKVAGVMLSARMKSVVERRSYTVGVDYAADTLSVVPSLGAPKLAGSVDLYADTSDPDCPPLSLRDVAFRPNGTADAAGFEAVYLKSRSAKVAVRYRAKILGATGKVSVERGAGGERGFTFVEVMVALSISIVVLLANLYLINTAYKDFSLARALVVGTHTDLDPPTEPPAPDDIRKRRKIEGLVYTRTWTVANVDLEQATPPVADMVGNLVKTDIDVAWTLGGKDHHVTMATFVTERVP